MNILLIGGNGYIGKALTKDIIRKIPNSEVFVSTRGNALKINNQRIHLVHSDLHDVAGTLSQLPKQVDVIIDLVGAPSQDLNKLNAMNKEPVYFMIELSEVLNTSILGYIGGRLGPKSFVRVKKEMIQKIKDTGKKVVLVEPTFVYGADRADSLVRMVPLFKFMGFFSKKFKPVKVESVSDNLVNQINELR
ncbi:NAD-dependent epimerase/dehydratase family protein [Companilactobacillus jidongensis]|uniref:NAD-dependent epimerase/dehydratase family protein n=1 Tax=Companilactobacillus jidongensis TaxID=2486006 RepID=UPI000F7889DE|nr:NAD-dependent epimerase/dehydratase family protein [Companilactobacillus jidongensis]